MNEPKTFYRIANLETQQGLWYAFDGQFSGLIHNEYNFCKNASLPMPFDPNIVGWLSATETLDELFNWFSQDDIFKLEKHGYYITVYEATEYKFHSNHWIISQKTSLVKETISTLIHF